MPQLLSLSRAARLLGVTRGELQKHIRNGELRAFDGNVSLDDLLAVFPDTQLEDNTEFSRVTQIKEKAFGKRVFERAMPDVEVLAARLTELSKELTHHQEHASQLDELLVRLRLKLQETESQCPTAAQATIKALSAWLLNEISGTMVPGHSNSLAIRNNILRVMSAHVSIVPGGQDFFIDGPDTLLEGALRSGIPLNYGCSGGNCGLCKARVVSGEVKKMRLHDYVIPEAEKAQGYVLMCCNTAVTDVTIEAAVAGSVQDIPFQQIATRVKSVAELTPDIAQLHLQTPRSNRLRFLAGQYVTLQLGGSLRADLPIASCPCDDHNLLFHVRRMPGNVFSDYLFNRLKPNHVVDLEGPHGEFILREKTARPLYFIAFDTGFAPIKSLIEHAISQDAAESIHLCWIGSDGHSIYLPNVGRAWADALDNFSFTPMVAGFDLRTMTSNRADTLRGLLHKLLDSVPNIQVGDIYLAGPEPALQVAESFFLALGLPKTRVFSAYRASTWHSASH